MDTDIYKLEDCSTKQIIYILNQYIFKSLEENDVLIQYKDVIISYFNHKQIDGNYLKCVDRKTLKQEMVKFGHSIKLNGASLKLLRLLTKFDFDQISHGALIH